jgi:hypothetical protein
MTSLSDTLTVGLVLVLLFGSIALYLYTRLQQAEQKISLLESILLDLKMSAEIKSYTELPASEEIKVHSSTSGGGSPASYKPFEEADVSTDESSAIEVTEYAPLDEIVGTESKHSSRPSSPHPADDDGYRAVVSSALTEVEHSSSSVNYDGMTIKELQTLAKSRGISSANSMKKASLIEALKTSDKATSTIEPGSAAGTAPFLETSSLLVGVDA